MAGAMGAPRGALWWYHRAMGLPRDMRHAQTPPNQREAEWWLLEHAEAERHVTSAAHIVELAEEADARIGGHQAHMARRILDAALDHLEETEDRCDAILAALCSTAPAIAEACEGVYIKQRTWRAVAEDMGKDGGKLYEAARRALANVNVTA